MTKSITVKEFIDSGAPDGKILFIKTAWGYQEVNYIRWPETNPWVVCPKMNAGFGQSFMVCYDTQLFFE